jgi:hypothetical protein
MFKLFEGSSFEIEFAELKKSDPFWKIYFKKNDLEEILVVMFFQI